MKKIRHILGVVILLALFAGIPLVAVTSNDHATAMLGAVLLSLYMMVGLIVLAVWLITS